MRSVLLTLGASVLLVGIACGGTGASGDSPAEVPARGESPREAPANSPDHIEFVDVKVGHDGIYVLQPDGSAWLLPDGADLSGLSQPIASLDGWIPLDVPLREIRVGSAHACGLTVAGGVYCRGDDVPEVSDAPEGTGWSTVSVGSGVSCALDRQGMPTCWGRELRGRNEASGGPYEALLARGETTCGLVLGKVEHCWGGFKQDAGPFGVGPFRDYSRGASGTCVVDPAGGVRCIGTGLCSKGATTEPCGPGAGSLVPDVVGSQVAVGWEQACAIPEAPGAPSCWGAQYKDRGVPGGPFLKLSGRGGRFCGVRHDQAVQCFGELPPNPG